MSVELGAFKTLIHRLRQQFADAGAVEVMQTVSAPHEVDDELRVAAPCVRASRGTAGAVTKMELLAQHQICETCGSSVELEMPQRLLPDVFANHSARGVAGHWQPAVASKITSFSMRLRAGGWGLFIVRGNVYLRASSQ